MEENGFALDAYHVPKCGADGPVPGGTMPKASNEAGSLFTEVKKNAKYPGPDYYKKEGKPFGQKAPLGQFSRIARDDPNSKKNWPAVGQYETITPVCTPRTRGGIMNKSTRGCLIYDQELPNGLNIEYCIALKACISSSLFIFILISVVFLCYISCIP
eukprot:symbB.v1.2.006319.t1/scaffold354.1/size221495/14